MTFAIPYSPAFTNDYGSNAVTNRDSGTLYLADGTYLVLVPRTVAAPAVLVYDLYVVAADRLSASVVVTDVEDSVSRAVSGQLTYPGMCRDSTGGIYLTFTAATTGAVRYLTKGTGLTWTKGTILSYATGSSWPQWGNLAWCNTGGGTSGGGHLLVKQETNSGGTCPAIVLDSGIIKQGSGSPWLSSSTTAFPYWPTNTSVSHLLPNDAPGAVGASEGWWAHGAVAGVRFGFWSLSTTGALTATTFGSVGGGAGGDGSSVRLLRINQARALLVHRSATAGQVGVTDLTKTGAGAFTDSTYSAGITGWPATVDNASASAYDRSFNRVWLYAGSSSPSTVLARIGGVLGTSGITWDTVAANTEASGLPAFQYYGGTIGPSMAPPGSRWDWFTLARDGTGLTFGSTLFNQPPYAPTLTSPANGATIDRTLPLRLAFTFIDPDSGDWQTRFDLRYKTLYGDWTTYTGVTPDSFMDAPGLMFPAGLIEWQTATYDATGAVGPYSASWFFTAADTPAPPVITAPVAGGTIATSAGNLVWTDPDQTQYGVRKVADLAGAPDPTVVYYDSGDTISTTTRTAALTFPANGRWEHLQVRIFTAGLWTAWASARVYVNYDPPMTPLIVLTPDPNLGSIGVTIINPAPVGVAPAVIYNDVLVSSPLDPQIRVATNIPPNSSWLWELPASGREYDVRAVAVAANGTSATSA